MGPTSESPRTELINAVRRATKDTPYVLTETAAGFDVSIDLTNANWLGTFRERDIKRTFVHKVRLKEPRKRYTITDHTHRVSWSVNGPTLGARIERTAGRQKSVEFGGRLGRRDDGSFGFTETFRFSSEEGRRLITEPATALGWTQGWFGSLLL